MFIMKLTNSVMYFCCIYVLKEKIRTAKGKPKQQQKPYFKAYQASNSSFFKLSPKHSVWNNIVQSFYYNSKNQGGILSFKRVNCFAIFSVSFSAFKLFIPLNILGQYNFI
uniref:Uncharacterized protein n=1 Tax=Micrurus lemniscatus lemniscatus TaxID=129467 RepID=A0A2D4I2G4_MICLE